LPTKSVPWRDNFYEPIGTGKSGFGKDYKSLFNWIHNQKTYLKWYKLGVSEEKKGKVHIDDRYVRYLRKLGVDVVLKVEGGAEEE